MSLTSAAGLTSGFEQLSLTNGLQIEEPAAKLSSKSTEGKRSQSRAAPRASHDEECKESQAHPLALQLKESSEPARSEEIYTTTSLSLSEGEVAKIHTLAKTLKELHIPRIRFGALQIFIHFFKNLEVLDVSRTPVTDEWLQGLKGSRLRVLKISHCSNLTTEGLQFLSSLESLRELHLRGSRQELYVQHFPKLEVLDMSESQFDHRITYFVDSQSLRKLAIRSCNNVSERSFARLLACCRGIQEVDIRGSSLLEERPDHALSFSKKYTVKVITFLDNLRGFDPLLHGSLNLDSQYQTVSAILRSFADYRAIERELPKELFQLFMKAAPTIYALDLTGTHQDQNNFAFLAAHFRNLQSLSFEKALFADRRLLSALKDYFPNLTTLNVTGLKYIETEIYGKPSYLLGDYSLAILVHGLSPGKLRTLILDETDVTAKGITEVSDAPQLEELRTLSLCSCNLFHPIRFDDDEEDDSPHLELPPKVERLIAKNTPGVTINTVSFDIEA